MNELSYMILAFIGGLSLGTLFFGGLWLTVRKTVGSKSPGLLVFGSFVIRGGLTVLGFYFIAGDSWKRLLLALVGFVIARLVILRLTKRWDEKQHKQEMDHEA